MESNPDGKFDETLKFFASEIKAMMDNLQSTDPFKMINFLKDKFPERIDNLTDQDRKYFPFIDDLGDKLNASHLIISILSKFHDMGHREGELFGAIDSAGAAILAANEENRKSPEHNKLVNAHENAVRCLQILQKRNASRAVEFSDLLVRVINQIVEIRMRETAKVSNN